MFTGYGRHLILKTLGKDQVGAKMFGDSIKLVGELASSGESKTHAPSRQTARSREGACVRLIWRC